MTSHTLVVLVVLVLTMERSIVLMTYLLTVLAMYIVEYYNHRIQVFSSDGQYLRQFGRKGKGERELDRPTSIAIDSHNVVYVTEWRNNRISIFTSDGEFIKAF